MRDSPTAKLGFGVSGPLGQVWFSAAKTRSLIEQALAGGVAHFDTAPFYFDAEARLGAALSAAREPVFVSTKTGTRRRGMSLVKDFSDAAIRRDVEGSRRSLDRDCLDLLYLHGPTTDEMRACLPFLQALKREGKVKTIGVCGEGEPLALAAEMGFDAIMGACNVMDRRNAGIFASAKAQGLMTVAVAPLAQGLFDPRFKRPESLADLWRLARARVRPSYDHAIVNRVMEALGDEDPAGRALGFVLADPVIDIVMTTTTKPRHLAASLAARPLSTEDYERLKRLSLDPEAGRS
jgi:aryl-alcohol dehydrogenase-like predicted oxidoreductase